jgi:hypothetical protein
MKTSELTGKALDWAVGKAEGLDGWLAPVNYCGKWEHGGPIIEREGIGFDQYADYPRWQAFTPAPEQPSGQAVCNGPTPLVAAMRCYVASKLGDDVEIPEELL